MTHLDKRYLATTVALYKIIRRMVRGTDPYLTCSYRRDLIIKITRNKEPECGDLFVLHTYLEDTHQLKGMQWSFPNDILAVFARYVKEGEAEIHNYNTGKYAALP